MNRNLRRNAPPAAALLLALGFGGCAPPPGGDPATDEGGAPASVLWNDATAGTIGETKGWTNKVEIADLDADGRPDLLFANGGDYSTPGTPEPNLVFMNTRSGTFENRTRDVFGETADLAHVQRVAERLASSLESVAEGLVVLRKHGPTPAGFPRRPGMAKKRPLA